MSDARGTTPAWGEAAEDWLAAKRVGRRRDDPGHADRARRADLRRWAAAIDTVMGREPVDSPHLDDAWRNVMTEIGDPDVLLRALDLLADELAPTSRQRMLSTLRGFCGYLTRRGLLTADPTLADELTVSLVRDDELRAFTESDIDALLAAAQRPPDARVRSAWPTRDAAVVSVLAQCGLRVGELCALTDASIDHRGERALVRVRVGAKGGRRRTVPLPSSTEALIYAYRTERDQQARNTRRLFVRHDGTPLNQQFVDALLRRLSRSAVVAAPDGAMAHALRHSYGARLAVRGVPVPIIQQLLGHTDPRTTSIYTAAHAGDLTATLDDAGLL